MLDISIYQLDPEEDQHVCVFEANITSNLKSMAYQLNIGEIWGCSGIQAVELIPMLEDAVHELTNNADDYRHLEAKNKWGTIKDFLPWLQNLLNACKQYPSGTVESWT